jgi:hypothetical protein
MKGWGLQGDCHWTQHIVLGSQSQKLNILAKPLTIGRREFFNIPSHGRKSLKSQDMKTISKPDRGQKTGFLRFISTQDIFTLS